MNKERNICIVGLGLLGGSYAMGLTDAGYTVTAVDVRPEAIRYALEMGREGDVIILAGKGNETYQDIMGVKRPFDEKVVVRELLAEMRA